MLNADATVEDPISGTTNLKSIPSATARYLDMMTNNGTAAVQSDTFVIIDPIPANTALRVVDFDGVNSGPLQFAYGAHAGGLAHTFVALGDPGDDVSFSNDGGTTFTCTPTADANGVDLTVTHKRIHPKDDFLGNSGGNDPNIEVYFKATVQ